MADMTSADFAFARYEHRQIKASLEDIRQAADTIGRLSPALAANAVSRIRAWLATSLGPHAAWEDTVVYPEIDQATATEWATKLMRFEHHQIERLGPVLEADVALLRTGPVSHAQLADIRAHLIGLEALLRAHIEKEETFLLPCLTD